MCNLHACINSSTWRLSWSLCTSRTSQILHMLKDICALDAKLVCAFKAHMCQGDVWYFVCIYLCTLCSTIDTSHNVCRLQDSAATGFAHDQEVLESASKSFPIVTPSGRDFGREDIWLWEYIPARLREKVTDTALPSTLCTCAACCVIWYAKCASACKQTSALNKQKRDQIRRVLLHAVTFCDSEL